MKRPERSIHLVGTLTLVALVATGDSSSLSATCSRAGGRSRGTGSPSAKPFP